MSEKENVLTEQPTMPLPTMPSNLVGQERLENGTGARGHYLSPSYLSPGQGEGEGPHSHFPSPLRTPFIVTDALDISEQATCILPALKIITDALDISEQATYILPAIKAGTAQPEKQAAGESESYISLMRNLVKSSGIYALASLASPLIALVLGPFLTHNLSHSDYGALAVLTTAIAFLAGLTQLGLGSAFFRAYSCDYESQKDRAHVLSTTIILLSAATIPTTLAVMITAPWLSEALFHTSSFSVPVRLAACVVLLQNLTVPGFAWLRARNSAGIFAMLAISNLLTSLITTIVLVGIVHMGIAGALLATGSGYGLIVFCTLPKLLLRVGFHLRIDITRTLLAFGLSVVFSFVSIWVLQLSDRYLLNYFGSLPQVASYSVAYTLGGALTPVIVSPFALAWPSTMYAIAKKENAARLFRLVFRWFSIVLLLGAYALLFTAVNILNLLFPASYHSAAPVIPVVAVSTMLYGIYIVFTLGMYIRRKPWLQIVFTTLAALANVGLNIILIPHYGSMGAAASTLIAYALLAGVAYMVNQRIYPVPFEIGKFGIALLLGVALYLGGTYLAQKHGILATLGIFSGTFIIYALCLVIPGVWPAWRKRAKHRQKEEVSLS